MNEERPEERMKLVIPRDIWARGKRKRKPTEAELEAQRDHTPWLPPNPDKEKILTNKLLDEEGKMCCLGIFGEACGIPRALLLNQCEPGEIAVDKLPENRDKRWDLMIVVFDEEDGEGCETTETSAGAAVFMNDNDNDEISELTRESNIAALFASIGVDVEYVDSKPVPRPHATRY